MRKITEIIVHCSATPEGRDYTVDDIDRWHRERGFNGIGYHYVVYRDGTVHQGREITRPGAHCKGHNGQSIGVCYIGGLAADGKTAKDTRTPRQIASLRDLIDQLAKHYPGVRVYGHREFANKACPCFDVEKEYRMYRV